MIRLLLGCLLGLLLQVSGHCADAAFMPAKKNVLILNSYHQGYKWTDDETRGVLEAMSPKRDRLKFYVEYMDTKWAFSKDYFRLLHETYRLKFRGVHFDLIIATDNDAFDYLRLYRDETFGPVPVAFCGVNWFDPKDLQGQTLYTGVNEDADIEANLDLMLKLHPGVGHIHIIIDGTTTGGIVKQNVLRLLPKYRNRVNIHLMDNLSIRDLLSAVSLLPSDSLVLLTVYHQDNSGALFEYSEIAEWLAQSSPVPVYGLWDFYLGHGILGGLLTSGKAQGISAGELGLRILAGEQADAIPVILKSPNRYLFDHEQLRRFHLLGAELPPGSQVINEPPPFYTLNKHLFWGLLTGFSGLASGLLALLLYLRARHRAVVDLRKSEERYHSLVDNLTLGIYRVSGGSDGRFIQANPAMAKMFGYESPQELLQVPIADLYQRSEERQQFITDILESGLAKGKELPMHRKDGEPVWVSVNAKAHRDAQGQLLWIDGIFEDVTEKKHLETQLRQSQKMEAIGTLAGGVAHDFNNILTVIIGYGNMLKKSIPSEGAAVRHLAQLLSASEKAARLTRSLLAFSRKQVISPKPSNLNDIVDGMGKLLHRVIGEDIELNFDLHPRPLPILVDAGQIEQVLLNLVTNARDSMPHGGLICVSTEQVELSTGLLLKHEFTEPGDYAVLSVSDNGSGIPDDIKQRIFEPFFSTKEVGKGTGLGLSILYGIVKQHHGDISVYSETGIGTTFKIYLPVIRHKGQLPASSSPVLVEGGTETILLAEDNDEVRALAREVLVSGGYNVVLAIDGEDAVTKFIDHVGEIDFVLLDVVMPRINGKEVYDTIKSIKPEVKALFMSGYTADIINQKGILDEGIHYLSKPLTPDALLRKIREVIAAK